MTFQKEMRAATSLVKAPPKFSAGAFLDAAQHLLSIIHTKVAGGEASLKHVFNDFAQVLILESVERQTSTCNALAEVMRGSKEGGGVLPKPGRMSSLRWTPRS